MKKLGIVFMVIGISMIGWFGYKYWSGMQSMTEISGDVVKRPDDDSSNKTEDSSNQTMETKEDEAKKDMSSHQSSDAPSKPVDYSNGEDIATLVMPSIGISYDVFWGTDDDVLDKGVGMYDSDVTTTPEQMGHTVLSGHRDSVFRPVGDLEDGDSIYVQYQDNDYEYKIHKIWITNAQDQGVIVDKDDPTLTLTTCYPFDFIGYAPDRYIVQAEYIKEGDLLDL